VWGEGEDWQDRSSWTWRKWVESSVRDGSSGDIKVRMFRENRKKENCL
jgi:hypothetical protein